MQACTSMHPHTNTEKKEKDKKQQNNISANSHTSRHRTLDRFSISLSSSLCSTKCVYFTISSGSLPAGGVPVVSPMFLPRVSPVFQRSSLKGFQSAAWITGHFLKWNTHRFQVFSQTCARVCFFCPLLQFPFNLFRKIRVCCAYLKIQ